jgi:hypothetical protein
MAGQPEMIDTAEISTAMVAGAPQIGLPFLDAHAAVLVKTICAGQSRRSYRRILVTDGVRRQRFELAI